MKMSLSRRLRNIALSQINAIKERLDRIDAEDRVEDRGARSEADARYELGRAMDEGTPIHAPQPTAVPTGAQIRPPVPDHAETSAPATPLSKYYRVMGVEEGADLSVIDGAYNRLVARCNPERFGEGSEERAAAREILNRVEEAYNALRDALDPTAGRFDKLEI